MTGFRGHISDKKKKGRHSPAVLSLCFVSVGIRLRKTEHEVRYTRVIEGSVSSRVTCRCLSLCRSVALLIAHFMLLGA